MVVNFFDIFNIVIIDCIDVIVLGEFVYDNIYVVLDIECLCKFWDVFVFVFVGIGNGI